MAISLGILTQHFQTNPYMSTHFPLIFQVPWDFSKRQAAPFARLLGAEGTRICQGRDLRLQEHLARPRCPFWVPVLGALRSRVTRPGNLTIGKP